MSKTKTKTVIRYRQSYNNKLLPVFAVISLVGVGNDRWAVDDYDTEIDLRAGIITVRERSSGIAVKFYNSNQWLNLQHMYRVDHGTGWLVATKLELVEVDDDDRS